MASVAAARRIPRRGSHDDASGEPLKRTPLYEVHKAAGAKFVPFCGWEMPVQYAGQGVVRETAACRTGAALFDVSHMGQLRVHGPDRERFAERVTVADVAQSGAGQLRYTIVPNARGGTVDDAMVGRMRDHLHMVVNSACYAKDMRHFAAHLADFPGVQLEPLYASHALVAVQGPAAARVVAALLDAPDDRARLARLPFMHRLDPAAFGGVAGVALSRCGYTGEDGFEVSMPVRHAPDLCRRMLAQPGAAWAGLGARDSLRLEAALSLYGHDLDDDTSLVEAGQAWCVTKRRRAEGGFVGADAILRQLREGVARKRVGLVARDGGAAPARDGACVHDAADGRVVGKVTSGGPSPTLGKNIAMGMVETKAIPKIGGSLLVDVRGRMVPYVVSKMPFFPHRFFQGP